MSKGIEGFREEWSWPKILGETLIVVVGVFLGIQVSNWNEGRIEKAETVQVLRNLRPELKSNLDSFEVVRRYYAVTRHYGDSAFAGWRSDPHVSDRDFVIAAYQASQISFSGINNNSWAQIFGVDRLRTVEDQGIRTDLGALMTTDYNVIEKEIFSDYREHVRQVIPEDIQDAIRAKCGDQRFGPLGYVRLPKTCSIDLPDERFHAAAKALRSHPELAGELRWHFAAVATYLSNIDNLDEISRRLLQRIESI